MQLYLNATSPYARVVRIVALEKGLHDLSLCWCDPWADDDALLAVNPAGRVPALVTDEGLALTESLLIGQYLDTQGDGDTLLPGDRLASVLELAGLGQGLMDAAFHTVIARKHHGIDADMSLLGQRRLRAIGRLLAGLEERAKLRGTAASPALGNLVLGNITLGDIVVAVALDYLAFRLPELNWPDKHPALAGWQRDITDRDSFQATAMA